MLGKLGRGISGAAILAAVVLTGRAEQLDSCPMPEAGMLLLRNGQVIEGKISRVGDLYYVALAKGEIRLKAAEVEFYCRDLEEGYRRRRATIQVGNVQDHLRLARWCQRHGLLGPAATELADALDADPSHPMIAVLERRLKTALSPPTEPGLPAAVPQQPPSSDELDRMVRGMPPGTVETFTQTIQPLLLNNCTAGGCHGPRCESDFHLLRISPSRPASRRITQRNLHAVLQWVDREQAASSRLLTAPIDPHGTAKTTVFTSKTLDQYKRLVAWVHQVAPRREAAVPASVDQPQKPAVHAMSAESPGFEFPPSQPPADPFDPEIFNRRYFGADAAAPRPTEPSRP